MKCHLKGQGVLLVLIFMCFNFQELWAETYQVCHRYRANTHGVPGHNYCEALVTIDVQTSSEVSEKISTALKKVEEDFVRESLEVSVKSHESLIQQASLDLLFKSLRLENLEGGGVIFEVLSELKVEDPELMRSIEGFWNAHDFQRETK